MPTINITVRNKKVVNVDGTIICGNSDYVLALDFDEEWHAYGTKTARFKYAGQYQDVVFSGSTCPVPVLNNTNTCKVGVYAGDLRTTTPAEIWCHKSILCGEAEHADPPEDVYNQIMETLGASTRLAFDYEDGNIVLSREDEAETIDTVTYDGLTLRDIFETNSIIQGGDFENGMPTIDGVAGTYQGAVWDEDAEEYTSALRIQKDVCDTGEHALAFESTADTPGGRFILMPKHTFPAKHVFYSALRVRVDEYTQGRIALLGVWAAHASYEYTMGEWERCSSYRSATEYDAQSDKTYNSWIGCLNTSDGSIKAIAKGCMDNVIVLDLTAIFGAGNEPSKTEMDALYDLYIQLKKNRVADRKFILPSVPATGDFSFSECLLKFKEVMNLKAKSLGMKNSAFDNPSGLVYREGKSEKWLGSNTSTAADVLKLGLAAFGNERLMEILNAYTYTCRTGGENTRALTTTSLYHGGAAPAAFGNRRYHLFGGKGGSLPASWYGEGGRENGILNGLCLCGIGDRQAVVATLGQNYKVGEELQGVFVTSAEALDVVYELLEGKKLEDITLGENLAADTTREEYPVSVAACVVPEGYPGSWANYSTEAILGWPTSYSSLPNEVHELASISKVLTALITLEYISDLDERVAIVDEDYVGGSGQRLNTGETLSFRDLLYLMLLESNNQAATALGRAVGERLLRRGENINYFRPVYEMKSPVLIAEPIYKLIETIEVTEDMVISRTQEPDGTLYAFDAMMLKIKSTAESQAGWNMFFASGSQIIGQHWADGFSGNTSTRYVLNEVYQRHGYWRGSWGNWTTNAYGSMAHKDQFIYTNTVSVKDCPHITKFYTAAVASKGTVIEVYGVRAR